MLITCAKTSVSLGKHITSLKQILHYCVTFFNQLTNVFSGFWVFAPALHLYHFYPAIVFLFCLIQIN